MLALFQEQKVTGILATSRPNDDTRALYEAQPKGLWVVPFIRPYRVRSDIQTWFKDPAIYELIQAEYKRGTLLLKDLTEGQVVRVKVLETDEKGRVKLSMKALLDRDDAGVQQQQQQQ